MENHIDEISKTMARNTGVKLHILCPKGFFDNFMII